MTHPRATLVLLTIQDDRLKVLVRKTSEGTVRLPSGHGDPEQDGDLAFTCRRLSKEMVGGMDYDMLPIHTFSRSSKSEGFDIHQIFAGFGRPENIPAELPADVLFADMQKLLFQYSKDGTEWERPFLLDGDQDRSLSFTYAHLKDLAGHSKVPSFLISREFTMAELIRAYEILADQPIDQASFRRKIATLPFLQEVGERRSPSRRPAKTYRAIGIDIMLRKFLTMKD